MIISNQWLSERNSKRKLHPDSKYRFGGLQALLYTGINCRAGRRLAFSYWISVCNEQPNGAGNYLDDLVQMTHACRYCLGIEAGNFMMAPQMKWKSHEASSTGTFGNFKKDYNLRPSKQRYQWNTLQPLLEGERWKLTSQAPLSEPKLEELKLRMEQSSF